MNDLRRQLQQMIFLMLLSSHDINGSKENSEYHGFGQSDSRKRCIVQGQLTGKFMAIPSRQLHFRMPEDMAQRFDELAAEFPQLQPTVILRLLVTSILERDRNAQIETVLAQLRRKAGSLAKKAKSQPKSGLNAKNRISGE